MAEDRKKELHKEKPDDTHDGEVSQEDIEKTVSEIEDAGGERIDTDEDAGVPDQEPHGGEDGRESLISDLEKSEQEAKDNYERYLRSAAELDNYKKRMKKETEDARRFANEELIKELIPVVDNLERALAHAEGDSDSGPFLDGVKMIHKQFIDVLTKYGVQEVVAIGKPFDPNFHQALMQVKTSDSPPNVVVSEIAKGYLLFGRLIRPSMVGVSAGGGEDEDGRADGNKTTDDSPWGNEEYAVEDGTKEGDAADTSEDEDK